jgi:hypothetical protein
MRRFAAAALLLVVARTASADGAPSAETIRAARDAVMSRPEFRYGAPRQKSFVEELWDGFADWLGAFRAAHPTLFLVVFAALAALLLAIVAHIVWTIRAAREARWSDVAAGDIDAAMRRGDAAPFRARAVEHAAAGRFDEAVRDLYAALLLTLDRRGAVRYASHKALLDYRIEAARDVDAARTLDLFASTYHPGSFGRRPPDRARFDELLDALDRVAENAR